jgi:hypothetical protein
MSSTELTREGLAPAPAIVDQATARRAARVVLLGAGIGLLVQFLFVESLLGVNFPITIATLLVAGWVARSPSTPVPRLADAWFGPAALVLAGFVAIRGDATLLVLDVLGAIGLVGLALASFSGYAIVRRPFERIVEIAGGVAGRAFIGAAPALVQARFAIPKARGAVGRAAPIIRGLLIAIPLVAIFAILFSAADAVFADLAGDLFDWNLDTDELLDRLLTAGIAAWFAAGVLGFVALRDRAAEPSVRPMAANRPRLGTTEAVIVLLALDLLFAAFVVIQAAYLFGGLDTLEATGMTYAEYARRGFFELLFVAFLVAGLILGLEAFIARRSRTYLSAAILLIVLTMVVLGSSLLRLRLYQEAYGWTELRFYVLAAIGWLAIGAVAGVVAVATNRTRWLLHVMVILSVVFGLAFNVIGPVQFIAEQNVARAIDPSLVPPDGETGLDVSYLSGLGTDADVVLAESLPYLPEPERTEVELVLGDTAATLENHPYADAWQGWNYSRETARALVVE